MSIHLDNPNILFYQDSSGHLRQLIHWLQPYTTAAETPDELATFYMEEAAEVYDTTALISNLNTAPDPDLNRNYPELRKTDKKDYAGISHFFYAHTYFGIPIWNQSMVVEVTNDPLAIRRSVCTVDHEPVDIPVPEDPEILQNYTDITTDTLQELLNIPGEALAVINSSTHLCVYQYKDILRFAGDLPGDYVPEGYDRETVPDVHSDIEEGDYYLVREVLFSLGLHWRCFIELQTGSVLYLEVSCSCATGKVMKEDPVTQGWVTGFLSDNVDVMTNQDLVPFTSTEPLHRLDPPVSGVQHLRGDYARVLDPVLDTADPMLVAPFPANALLPHNSPVSETAPFDFSYPARTEDFAAVNAYYHVDRFLYLITDLGFPLTPTLYLPGIFHRTPLPIRVDHRAFGNSGTQMGASCIGNTTNILALGLAFGRITTNIVSDPNIEYYGLTTSYRMTLHELSHVLLLDHLLRPNFDFAHSFGDSLAAILNDPHSAWAPPATNNLRFATFAWDNSGQSTGSDRWHNKDQYMASGWYWGGSQDIVSGYYAEQLLSTTLFKAYRALGGDATNAARREFAARMIVAVILKAVHYYTGTAVPTIQNNGPVSAAAFCNDLIYYDTYFSAIPDSVDNVRMGTAHKVLRWVFEKMAAYNAPSGTPPTTFTPPLYDIYIDDGRNGGYGYVQNFWGSDDIFNRLQNDGAATPVHQNPLPGTTNYLFVRVKNRGIDHAVGISVKAYKSIPAGGNVWPLDWTPLNTTPFTTSTILPSGQQLIVGGISWVPATGQRHICLLVTVNATGDPANTDLPGAPNIPIPDWQLAPVDNNIAQRNLNLLAAASGSSSTVQDLSNSTFLVRNPYQEAISATLEASLPALLREKEWQLEFSTGNQFNVTGFNRDGVPVGMSLTGGTSFTRQDVQNTEDRDIVITIHTDRGIIGGVSYRMDPDLEP